MKTKPKKLPNNKTLHSLFMAFKDIYAEDIAKDIVKSQLNKIKEYKTFKNK